MYYVSSTGVPPFLRGVRIYTFRPNRLKTLGIKPLHALPGPPRATDDRVRYVSDAHTPALGFTWPYRSDNGALTSTAVACVDGGGGPSQTLAYSG